jgi:hypothetical protein
MSGRLMIFGCICVLLGYSVGYSEGKNVADRWWSHHAGCSSDGITWYPARDDSVCYSADDPVKQGFGDYSLLSFLSYDHAMAARRTNWLERQLKYRQHEIDVLAECHYQTSPPKTAWCARELEKVDTDKRGMRYEADSFGWPEGKP